MPAPIIFLSYRRSDSQHATGRLRSGLVPRHFAASELFMDIDDIAKGTDFAARLDEQLATCKVVLVVIGKTWLTALNEHGRRRLDDPNDFVAREIATCIQRGIPVIPVLVDDAKMPTAAQLPDALSGLATRNAMFVVHERFAADTDALARAVKRLIGRPEDAELDLLKTLFSFKGTASRKQFWVGIGALLLAQLAVLAAMFWSMDLPVLRSLASFETLPVKNQVAAQIVVLPFLWPTLAIVWKRIRDIGHGWGVFAPFVGLGAGQTVLALMGRPLDAATVSLICLVLLLVLGTIIGTRFVADAVEP